jgi:hypothetical protein
LDRNSNRSARALSHSVQIWIKIACFIIFVISEMMPKHNGYPRNHFMAIPQTCNSVKPPYEWASWAPLKDSGSAWLYSHPLSLDLSSNRKPDNTFKWPKLVSCIVNSLQPICGFFFQRNCQHSFPVCHSLDIAMLYGVNNVKIMLF